MDQVGVTGITFNRCIASDYLNTPAGNMSQITQRPEHNTHIPFSFKVAVDTPGSHRDTNMDIATKRY